MLEGKWKWCYLILKYFRCFCPKSETWAFLCKVSEFCNQNYSRFLRNTSSPDVVNIFTCEVLIRAHLGTAVWGIPWIWAFHIPWAWRTFTGWTYGDDFPQEREIRKFCQQPFHISNNFDWNLKKKIVILLISSTTCRADCISVLLGIINVRNKRLDLRAISLLGSTAFLY